jgi:hypothetical protein
VLQIAAAAPASADVPNPIGIVTGPVSDLLGGAAGWAFDKVAEGIANWVLGAVAFFVNGVIDILRSSTKVDVEAAWFAGPNSPYATVRNIAAALLVGFVFLGLLQGLLHGDPWAMVRRMAGNLPAAIAGMVVATAVAARLLELTDALSNTVLASSDDQALHFLSGFGVTVTSATQGFAAVVLGLVAVLAGLLLWIELLVRASLVYLLVAISPLGFAATLWPSARGFLRRTIEVLLAVILSKFVVCVCLAVGVAALAGAGSTSAAGGVGASIGTLLVGAVLLGLAAFSPFLVVKLIPIAEAAIVAQGISRGPARAAQSGMSTYSSTRMVSRLSGSGQAGARGAASSPAWSAPGPSQSAMAGSASGASAAGAGVGAVAVGAARVGAAVKDRPAVVASRTTDAARATGDAPKDDRTAQ